MAYHSPIQAPTDPELRWGEADYSWDGLATKPWRGETGALTLQDYWRRGPRGGRARTDAQMRAAGDLVDLPGGRTFSIHHISDRLLAALPSARQQRIRHRRGANFVLRLKGASAVDAESWGKELWVAGSDSRAQLQGCWVDGRPFAGLSEVHAVFADAFLIDPVFDADTVFGDGADFRRTYFHGPAEFPTARFGLVSFDGSFFASGADFSRAKFDGVCFFNDTWFEVGAAFEGTQFSTVLDFYRAMFVNGADFSDAKFWNLGLGDAAFLNRSTFERVQVSTAADFTGAYLGGEASFRDARFGPNTSFEGAHFATDFSGPGTLKAERKGAAVTFTDARFDSSASFKGARFGGQAKFEFATFEPVPSFEAAHFEAVANFTGAALGRRMSFAGAVFGGLAWFPALPEGPPVAGAVEPSLESHAPGRGEFHAIDFRRAVFGDDASFGNRRFLEAASFDESVWCGVPVFHGATFRQDVSFEGAIFPVIERNRWPNQFSLRFRFWSADWPARGLPKTGAPDPAHYRVERARRVEQMWPPLEPGGIAALMVRMFGAAARLKPTGFATWHDLTNDPERGLERRYADLERAFRAMRMALGAAGAKASENRFFQLEMTARYRRPGSAQIGPLERGLAYLYRITSNFGQSLVRPLVTWSVAMLIFAMAFWAMGKVGPGDVIAHLPWPGRPDLDPDLGQALQLAIASALRPFEVWSVSFERQLIPGPGARLTWLGALFAGAPLAARLWSSLASLSSLTLLFLFALAVRRRFQVG